MFYYESHIAVSVISLVHVLILSSYTLHDHTIYGQSVSVLLSMYPHLRLGEWLTLQLYLFVPFSLLYRNISVSNFLKTWALDPLSHFLKYPKKDGYKCLALPEELTFTVSQQDQWKVSRFSIFSWTLTLTLNKAWSTVFLFLSFDSRYVTSFVFLDYFYVCDCFFV